MAATWLKVLTSIDIRNKIIQARNATIDVEDRNLQSLLEEMKHLRKSFPSILQEAKHVATAIKIEPSFPVVREKKEIACLWRMILKGMFS